MKKFKKKREKKGGDLIKAPKKIWKRGDDNLANRLKLKKIWGGMWELIPSPKKLKRKF